MRARTYTSRTMTTPRKPTASAAEEHHLRDSFSGSRAAEVPGGFDERGATYLFPSVRGVAKSGKPTEWMITVRAYASEEDARASGRAPLVVSREIASGEDLTTPHVARIRTYRRIGDGAVLRGAPTLVFAGKSVGHCDETNAFCQALRDAHGLYNKYVRRMGGSARADVGTATRGRDVMPRPMLARVYSDVFSDDDDPSPLFVQRKYNGVRAVGMMLGGEAILYSRKGLLYEGFTELKREIALICGAWRDSRAPLRRDDSAERGEKKRAPARAIGTPCAPPARCTEHRARAIECEGRAIGGALYLDGELYKHGEPLQIISGIVRRANDDEAQSRLSFVVYDIFVVNEGCAAGNALTADERFAFLRAIARSEVARGLQRIIFAETETCVSRGGARAIDAARAYYERYLREGYEGAIVRMNAQYEHSPRDRHSSVLLKIKPVRDAEYRIVGFTTGERGRADGALLFVCETDGGDRFNITPRGPIADRIAQAREFARAEDNGRTVFENHWLGRALIVFFDELSPAGVPQRARTDGVLRVCE